MSSINRLTSMRTEVDVSFDRQGRVILETKNPQFIPWHNLRSRLHALDENLFDLPPYKLITSWHGFAMVYQLLNTLSYITTFSSEVKLAIVRIGTNPRLSIDRENVSSLLAAAGFTGRTLTPEQTRDLLRLASMQHGANFSVPGAGKTTVSIALHLLWRSALSNPVLFVVSPINAFIAWDETLATVTCEPASSFLRLNSANVYESLDSDKQYYIVNYEQLHLIADELIRWMPSRDVHIIADESHRIKSFESIRTRSIHKLAPFSLRRDILSGTPAPQATADLAPQFALLYPGSDLPLRLTNATPKEARSVIADLFVRTTKGELDLPPEKVSLVKVDVEGEELELYSLLVSDLVRELSDLNPHDKRQAKRIGDCVMHLIRCTVDPAFVRDKTTAKTRNLLEGLDDRYIPKKFIFAKNIISNTIAQGDKVVVWSTFPKTLEDFSNFISPIDSVTIHGGISSEPANINPDGREARIERFHNDSNCRVLIANPAACSEGISLHHAAHTAIYLDRSFNAAHFLQSKDRIHRLGLSEDTLTRYFILQGQYPGMLGIDSLIESRLRQKVEVMANLLDDAGLFASVEYEDGTLSDSFNLDFDDLYFLQRAVLGSND